MITQKTVVTLCVTVIILVAMILDKELSEIGRYLLMLVGLGG